MAGHSKWANIQHRKGAQDKKRGKIFTKCIKEIGVAARMGGSSDPGANPRLRLAVDKALAANMPKDTIERAAKKGAGELEGDAYVEVRYEGYGPGGVAVMVDCLTDNHIRTVADVRHAFSKCNGNLGTDGSVAYLFTKLGVLHFSPGVDQDRLMEFALEAGADDLIVSADGSVEVITKPDDFSDIKDKIMAAGFKPELAEVTMRAATSAELDVEAAQKMIRLTEMLDDLDDVQQVYSNADIAEEILAQL